MKRSLCTLSVGIKLCRQTSYVYRQVMSTHKFCLQTSWIFLSQLHSTTACWLSCWLFFAQHSSQNDLSLLSSLRQKALKSANILSMNSMSPVAPVLLIWNIPKSTQTLKHTYLQWRSEYRLVKYLNDHRPSSISVYSGDLNTKLVWYFNGRKEVECQMVWFFDAI